MRADGSKQKLRGADNRCRFVGIQKKTSVAIYSTRPFNRVLDSGKCEELFYQPISNPDNLAEPWALRPGEGETAAWRHILA